MIRKIQGPSQLANLDGKRCPGDTFKVKTSKPPKRRFSPGDVFNIDGEIWELIYMFRLVNEPGVWRHCLESRNNVKPNIARVGTALSIIGAGATTPRIAYEEFYNWQDAHNYFRDIYRFGDSIIKTTAELLKVKLLSKEPNSFGDLTND